MSHALPDVRDGLPLVYRRVLLAMSDAGIVPGGPYKKSVTIVRDVFKRFRPRVRASAYDALVAIVQGFTFRYPLIGVTGILDRSREMARPRCRTLRCGCRRSQPSCWRTPIAATDSLNQAHSGARFPTSSSPKRMELIKDDLRRIADAYGDKRRTAIG